MTTEAASPRFTGIDAWDPADVLDALVEGQMAAVAAVRAVRGAIEAAAGDAVERLAAGGRLAYAGAGTSGRLALQDGAELVPTFDWPRDRLVLLVAGGDRALMQAVEGAEDQAEDGQAEVAAAGLGPDDVLIALAASGTTPYTLACLQEARARGALGIGIANNPGTPILQEANHGIWLDTGPEAIAGSTRLKAGTSQKVALNLLSSLMMIRLGRVYEGLMVDVQATNDKLVRRSLGMVRHLTGCSAEQAGSALERAGGSVKLAVLVVRGLSPEEARRAVEEARGSLREALARIAPL
jgi:N-acetylmuramic acid 6-phosphate etherase